MLREPRFRRRALLALLLTLLVSALRPAPAAAFPPLPALTLASFDLHTSFQAPQLAVVLDRSAAVTYSLNAFSIGNLLHGSRMFSTVPGIGPVISNATVTPNPPPVTGGSVTVSADVTDSSASISTVYAYIYDPNGNFYNNIALAKTAGNTYSGSVPIPQNLSNTQNGYTIKVYAADRSGNTTITGTLATQGFDNIPPVIANASIAPNPPPATGGSITVSADVTDAGTGVAEVDAVVYSPSGSQYNSVALTKTSGNTYSGNVSIPQNLSNTQNGYSIKVVAVDRSSNSAITGTLATQGFDNVAPVISNITQTPSLLPESGGNATVSATVTDAGTGVGSVSVLIYKDHASGNFYSYSATLSNGGTGNVYTGTYTIGASGNTETHTFAAVVLATDRSSNTASNTTGNLVYQSTGAPNPVPQLTSLSPNQVAQGTKTDTTIYVIGSNFVPQSSVLANGSPVATAYDSNTQIHFTLPASDAVNAVAYMVQVNNPAVFGTDGGTSDPLSLTIVPVSLTSLTFPTPVPGGTVVTATVTLNEATPTDMVVGLSSSDSSVIRVHRSVIVPAGTSSATFEIDTYRSHVTKTVTIQATLGAVVLTKDLTITGR